MRKVTIARGGTLALHSIGNGWAYELTLGGRPVLVVQDDDATAFRAQWDALEAAHPDASFQRLLWELWSDFADLDDLDEEGDGECLDASEAFRAAPFHGWPL